MRVFIHRLILLATLIVSQSVWAEEFPARSISIVVGAAPGGAADVQARLVANELSQRLGKPVIVENKSGAGGRIGAQAVARAAPDGHTMFLCSTSIFVIEPLLRANIGYDPLRDFSPVAMLSEMPLVLVTSSNLAVHTIEELIALSKKRKDMTFASWGPGTLSHLYGEQLKAVTNTDFVHVPYKGAGPALIDVMANRVSFMFASPSAALPHIKAGKLRALAVTGTQKLPAFGNLPTLKDAGISGFEVQAWFGLVVSSKTPDSVQSRLRSELAKIVESEKFSQSLQAVGGVRVATDPREYIKRLRNDTSALEKLVKSMDIKVED